MEELIKHYNEHIQRMMFIDMRKRFITDQEEFVYHEVEALKSEKKLCELLQPNLVMVLTDPSEEIRNIAEQFKNGRFTGKVISQEMTWDDLYASIDALIFESQIEFTKVKEQRLKLDKMVRRRIR